VIFFGVGARAGAGCDVSMLSRNVANKTTMAA
jgi:hypothetical protein